MNSTWIGVLSMGSLDRPGIDGLLRGERQREEEHRSLAHFPFGPDASPMPLHDALNGRQPDAGAGVLACGMQALKRAEELDRKSTRLNSSHLGISYAVFCLKTKKETSQLQLLRHLARPLLHRTTHRQLLPAARRLGHVRAADVDPALAVATADAAL